MSDIPFAQLIQQVDKIQSATIPDEIKLRRSGELICFLSEQILQKAKTLLENQERCLRLASQSQVTQADTQIDRSFGDFLASLTQQSISTNFLAKYLQPQQRADYYREITRSIKFLSATEALDELAEDLIESEVFALAHDENIEVWIESVEQHLKLYPEINTLPEIAKSNHLTLAQTFIAALFGNFQIKHFGGFYEVRQLKLFR